MGVEETAAAVQKLCDRVQMCFVPRNLDYLRAGGRVSNVVALTGNLLNLHPCIEIVGGKLLAKKKYRGALVKLIPKLIGDFSEKHRLEKKCCISFGLPVWKTPANRQPRSAPLRMVFSRSSG